MLSDLRFISIITGWLLLVPINALAGDESIASNPWVQIVAIVAPIVGTLGVAWFNLRTAQKSAAEKLLVVETKTTALDSKAIALDTKVDGVKADVALVHEATNGLSHRLSEAAGDAGFGRGQERERKDERLRVAEATAAAAPPPPGPAPTGTDARSAMLTQIETMLRQYHSLPVDAQAPDPPARETLRNAVAAIQEKTDQMNFSTPNVVDAGNPPPPKPG